MDKNATQQFSSTVEFRDVNGLVGSLENEAVFTQLSKVVEKADLLKYEVVFKYGGIYIDVDTISIRPLEHHLRNSFVGYSHPWHNICNSIFGFPQGSHFLKFVLEAARVHFAEASFENLTVPERFGPTFFTTTFVHFEDPRVKMISIDYLLKNRTKSNLLVQTNDCN